MLDPLDALLTQVELALGALPDVELNPPAAAAQQQALESALGRPAPAGFAAFLRRHDGGKVGPRGRLLTISESLVEWRVAVAAGRRPTVWPVLELAGRRFALHGDGAQGGDEWPIVEITAGRTDRTATSFLRFLHLLAAEMAAGPDGNPVVLGSERCARDPENADHWVELAELLEESEDFPAAHRTLVEAQRVVAPRTPGLLLAVGLDHLIDGQVEPAHAAFAEVLTLPALGARDEDARLDAAALLLIAAERAGDGVRAAEMRRTIGEAASAVSSFWRGEALHALGHRTEHHAARARLSLDIVAALAPTDPDVAPLRAAGADELAVVHRMHTTRELLDHGDVEPALAEARAAVAAWPALATGHAVLAEACNAAGERNEAAVAARRALELNPALVEAWRELGEALLDGIDLRGAEEAFRRVTELDPTYGLGHAKLAQALLEQQRTLEALESIGRAAERGGDPFFVAAVRGDILAEMERHGEAAAAYEDALRFEPDDHWTLHQAAVELGLSGAEERAVGLFEAAIANDHEGCHQTLVDYGDLLRRMGRIGDAVRLYRKAVTAVPDDQDWRETLREAERELLSAPN